jgi:hypothetical protein
MEAPPSQVEDEETKTPLSFEKRGFHDRSIAHLAEVEGFKP